jgi:hypothetical protein
MAPSAIQAVPFCCLPSGFYLPFSLLRRVLLWESEKTCWEHMVDNREFEHGAVHRCCAEVGLIYRG